MTDTPTGPTCPLSADETSRRAAQFGAYWSNNYRDGCVIAAAEWHRPRFERLVGRLLREQESSAITAERARLREAMPDWDEIYGPDTLALFDRACAAVDEKARESAP